jgi:hypothetical protein
MNNRTHRKRAVVSLTKARIIFTHRTKKRNHTKPKPASSTHLDEWMAQLRRETLKYAQGTLFRLVPCSCKVFWRFAGSVGTISFVFRVYVKVIIDPWTDHLQDHPMGRNPNTLVYILGALHPRSGVPIRQLLRKLKSSPEFKSQGARYYRLRFKFYLLWLCKMVLEGVVVHDHHPQCGIVMLLIYIYDIVPHITYYNLSLQYASCAEQ